MGLDITVRRICKREEVDEKYDYFRLVDDEGNYKNDFPEWTKDFETSKVEQCYDWQKYKEETGIDITKCRWIGESYGGEGCCFLEVCPKDAKLPEWNDGKGWKDFDNYQEAYDKAVIKIDLEKVPTYEKEVKVLYYKKIGYQRKGLNSNFYDDFKKDKIGYFVWTKAELERYKEDYCDEPYEYRYPNGKMPVTMIYPKQDFQQNIIDNFEEGKDCVTFSW